MPDDIPDLDAPQELRAIAGECSYFTSSYPEDRLQDLMGSPTISCDFCQRWDNGYCDIFLKEKYGSSTEDDHRS